LHTIRTGVAAVSFDGAAIGIAKALAERAQPSPAVKTASLILIALLPIAVPGMTN
jgi:hypothetical protein